MQWNDFAGNHAARAAIAGYVDSGHLPHALLLEGPAGSGRRTMARLIAQAAVCLTQKGEKPCGQCAGCHKAAAGVHPDIRKVEGEGKSHSITVDVIRELREQAYVLPNEAPHRVTIIAGAQDMNEAAQNALLKVLEEPPAHMLFLLTCENRSQMLPTIQSRTLCISLFGVGEEEGWPVICRRLPQTTEQDARRALRLFGGLIGQAIEGLQGGGLSDVIDKTTAMAQALVQPDELPLLRLTATMDKTLWDGALLQMRARYMNPTLFSVVSAARLRQAAGR